MEPGHPTPVGTPLRAATRPTAVNGVAFSPDGKLLATADSDAGRHGAVVEPGHRTARRHPCARRAWIRRLVGQVAFSPDGKLLATADNDGTVRLWNPATRQPIGSPLPADTGPNGRVNGLAFSPDGKLLATADRDDKGGGTVRLWNAATGQPVGFPLPVDRTRGSVSGLAFSPDGELLATVGWDDRRRHGAAVESGHRAAHRHPSARAAAPEYGGSVNALTFSPDGKLLATADSDGTVRLWNPATRQPVGTPLHAAPDPTAWTRWRSARTASCWPPPWATRAARCDCGTRPPGSPSAAPLHAATVGQL